MSKDPTQPGESAEIEATEDSAEMGEQPLFRPGEKAAGKRKQEGPPESGEEEGGLSEEEQEDGPPLRPSKKALGKRPEGRPFVSPGRLEAGSSTASTRAPRRQPQPFLPGQQAAWIAAVNAIDPRRLAPEPAAMLDHALGEVRDLLAMQGEADAQATAFWRVFKKSTLYRDVWPSPEFQALLRSLMSGEDVDATPVLEDMRDTLAALKQVIDEVTVDEAEPPSSATLKVRQELEGEIDGMLAQLGSLAVGEKRGKRGLLAASTAPLGALPYFAGYFTKPKSFLYLSQFSGALSRTLSTTVGLGLNEGTGGGLVLDHFKNRHLIWILPFFAYFAQTFGPYFDPAKTQSFKDATHNPYFLTLISVAEFAAYVGLDQWEKVAFQAGKAPFWTDSSKFRRGLFTHSEAPAGDEAEQDEEAEQDQEAEQDPRLAQRQAILALLERYETDRKVVNAVRDAYAEGQPLSGAMTTQLLQMNVASERFLNRLDLVAKGIKAELEARLAANAEDADPEDPGDGKPGKKTVGATLGSIAVVLAVINVVAARKEVILLTDYAPYYAYAVIRLLAELAHPAFTTQDLQDTFTSLFGGTLVGTPASFVNVVREGIYNLEISAEEAGSPGNETEAGHEEKPQAITAGPDLAMAQSSPDEGSLDDILQRIGGGAMDPGQLAGSLSQLAGNATNQIGNGTNPDATVPAPIGNQIAFGVGTAYLILVILLYSGKAGQHFTTGILKLLAKGKKELGPGFQRMAAAVTRCAMAAPQDEDDAGSRIEEVRDEDDAEGRDRAGGSGYVRPDTLDPRSPANAGRDSASLDLEDPEIRRADTAAREASSSWAAEAAAALGAVKAPEPEDGEEHELTGVKAKASGSSAA